MNRRAWSAMIVAGWMAAGCQSMHIKTQSDPQVAFANLHTFCWLPPPAWLHNDPRLHMSLVEPLVRRDVVALLNARGFRQSDCATADFQVTFTGGLQDTFTQTVGPQSTMVFQYSPGSGGEWFTHTSNMKMTDKRTPSLIIQLQRPGSDQILWQGMASANLPAPVNDAEREQRIQTAVRLIMHQFPPPPGK
jgi:hypothetical protein